MWSEDEDESSAAGAGAASSSTYPGMSLGKKRSAIAASGWKLESGEHGGGEVSFDSAGQPVRSLPRGPRMSAGVGSEIPRRNNLIIKN